MSQATKKTKTRSVYYGFSGEGRVPGSVNFTAGVGAHPSAIQALP